MMQTQTPPVQIPNYLYEPNVDTLPTHSHSTLKCSIKMDLEVRETLVRKEMLD